MAAKLLAQKRQPSQEERCAEKLGTRHAAPCPAGTSRLQHAAWEAARRATETPQCACAPALPTNLLRMGVRLACLAYTDDEPGTVDRYDTCVLRGTLQAIEDIAGSAKSARAPLSYLAGARLGLTVDRIISHRVNQVDTQGFIAHNDSGDIVLSFRGTTDSMDWATNLDYKMVGFKPLQEEKSISTTKSWILPTCACVPCGGRRQNVGPSVHNGFYSGLLVALPDLDQFLLPQLDAKEPKRVIITGHSLGGALATGAFAYLLKKFDFAKSPHHVHLVTFGAPRFGDSLFAKELDAQVALLRKRDARKASVSRIVHDADCVATVPPRFLGFSHIGGLVRLSDCRQGISHVISATAPAPVSVDLVKDHEPIRYLHAVDEFVQKRQ